MKLRKCRFSRTLKLSVVVCTIFVCVQIYYFHWISEGEQSGVEYRNGLDLRQNTTLPNLSVNVTLVPSCTEPLTPEAIRAIGRAKSAECKNDIATVACLHQKLQLYPHTLPRYCPLQGNNSGEYVGCFQDNAKSRIFRDFVTESSENNSPEYCINYCLRSGFNYAGVQYRYECWCGSSMSETSLRLSEGRCNNICPGSASHSMCGGYLAMNVYLTGFGVNAADYVSATNVNHSHHQQQQQQVVRIVFVLTVNGRALRQVTRLLRAIYRPHHYYYIHVDSRQEYLHRELSALSSHFMNIRMSASRHSTIWGGASLLTTLLECISELMLIDTWHWDYFLNLSESDYPIKPVEELELFLAVNKGKNFVKSHGKDTPRFIRKQGLNMLFYECDNHMWRLGARQPQDGIRIDGGSDWVCLSHQFAQYLLTEDLLVTGLKQYWKYALLPAESFFHTVLQNSIYCTTVVNNNLHFTNWRRKQGCKCQYKHVVDWCGCSPNDLLPGDKQKIQSLRHRPIYFARKFEAVVSQTIINQVDEFIYADSLPADTPGLNSFWLNEYHYKDVNATVSMSSLHSHYIPFARHALQHVAATTSCQLALTQLLEVTVYMSADKFSGLIVSFNASISGDNTSVYGESKLSRVMSVEVLLQPTLNLMFHSKQTSHLVAQRLQHLQVGSEYDPKEEIFRNYAGLLDSESEVIIQLSWRSGRLVTGSSTSVQLLTFDPTNVVVDVVDVSVNVEGATVFVHRPALTRPLRSGLWMVQVVEQSTDTQTQFNDRQQQSTETVIARRGFLVLPSSVVQDSGGQAEFDLLIAKAWKVTAGCLVSSTATDKSCYQEMSACLRTPWSTRYPDPKSWLVSTQQ